MAIFLVKFPVPKTPDEPQLADVLVDAGDGDAALSTLERNGITETPSRLIELPPGLLCAEVQWADDEQADPDDLDEQEANPANFADGGIVFVPFDALADFLELEQSATPVIDAAAPAGGS